MPDNFTPLVSIPKLKLEPFSHGEHYASQDAGISELLRLSSLGASYTEVPPGKSSCPFHVHHVEDEMFIILEGEGSYRFGDQVFSVKAGDVLGAPCGGPEYAHKLTNTGEIPLRYLSISSKAETEVCEYPDSGKFQVMSRRNEKESVYRFIGRKCESLDYWDGETEKE